MNLATIQSQLYGKLNLTATPNSDVVARILGFINEAQRELLGMKGLDKLRRSILTFASVANSPFAVLPQAAVQVITVMDRTNNVVLTNISLQELRFTDPGLVATTGYPYEYAILNLSSAVTRQPAAAGVLSIVSTSASDGATKTAYVEGVDSSGNYKTASIALNGVTPVAPAGSTWVSITKFYIGLTAGGATTAAGAVTLSDAAANVLSTIPVGYFHGRYSMLHLHPTPTGVVTYYADVVLHVEDMANGGDEPMLPEDFHYLLIAGAAQKEYDKREKPQQAAKELQRWQRGVSDMKLFVRRKSGVAISDRRLRRFSQLGSNFPSGT